LKGLPTSEQGRTQDKKKGCSTFQSHGQNCPPNSP
jgi:hypothetical protein